jgi:hypothetical protein
MHLLDANELTARKNASEVLANRGGNGGGNVRSVAMAFINYTSIASHAFEHLYCK